MRKLQLILQILLNLNFLSEILPFFFCLLFFKKINSKEIKVFFVYKTIAIILLAFSLVFSSINNIKYSNISVYISVVLEFILLSIMYCYIIKSLLVKKLIIFSIFLFVGYWVYNFSKINLQEFYFDFLTVSVESLFFYSCNYILFL